jgi:uncharacterized protein YjiS (DUF1127 family)
MLVKRSTQSASRVVGQYEVSGNEADGRKTTFWSSVVGYFIESFALYAASMYPTPLFPIEPRPDQQNMPQPKKASRHERRGFLTLVSTTASQAPSSPGPEPEISPAPPAGDAIGFAGDSRREREIKQAVAALAELDDRTLRDLGIPHRSHIEQTVRYCHDC